MHEKSIICLNGQFLPSHAATIHVADRGFRFGDGVFETIRLVEGVPYQWEAHLARLSAGLEALRIAVPQVDWMDVARQLIHHNNSSTGVPRISISRGGGSRGYMPNVGIIPTWVMDIIPAAPLPEAPLTLWASSITRPPLTSLPANHKLAHGIGSTLALMEAHDQGCDEALLLSHNAKLSECASGNLFWIAGDKIFTPALSTACLAGTTRAAILRLSPVRIEEVVSDISALTNGDAAFISNARLGVWPIARLAPNQKNFTPAHPIITELAQRLEADRAAYVAQHRAHWIAA